MPGVALGALLAVDQVGVTGAPLQLRKWGVRAAMSSPGRFRLSLVSFSSSGPCSNSRFSDRPSRM